MYVPPGNLAAQHESIKDELRAAIENVMASTAFIGGQHTTDFEATFAKALGVKHVIGVGNGTDAISIVLRALGIGEGDEVIVPANTFFATAEAASNVGAHVIFTDCEKDDYGMSIADAEKRITPRTKAIIVVHMYGQPVDLDAFVALAKRHNIALLEDSSHAHLAKYKGKYVGSFGIAGTFSFYPSKNLGACGDAGAIATNDDDISRRCRIIANHGQDGAKYNHVALGCNSRLDAIQAAILNVKLGHLDSWTERRRLLAERYDIELKDTGLILPNVFSDRRSVYHQYVVRTKERDELMEYLKGKNISVDIHYPIGLPFLPVYRSNVGTAADFPITREIQDQILSLPIYPEMTDEQQSFVIDSVRGFARKSS